MPVPTSIDDLSTTAGSNYPQGTDTPSSGDDVIRALSSFTATLRDKLNGTSNTGTVKNASFSGTQTGEASWSGRQSFSAGIDTNDISASAGVSVGTGVTFANSAQSGSTVLDWYEEGTFTPGLAFSGATTGITYNANRGGNFTRIGNRVFFELRLRLSNKGSASGNASITGLPYAYSSSGITESPYAVDYLGMSGLSGAVVAAGITSSTNVSLVQQGVAASTSLTEANFTNSSDIYVSGHYRV